MSENSRVEISDGESSMPKNSGQFVTAGALGGAYDPFEISAGAGSPPRPVPHFQQLSKLSSDASLHLGQFHMVI